MALPKNAHDLTLRAPVTRSQAQLAAHVYAAIRDHDTILQTDTAAPVKRIESSKAGVHRSVSECMLDCVFRTI